MKAIIATNNKEKLEAAKKALQHYWNKVNIIQVNVPSEVSSQPINNEIYKGVKNRINNLKKYCQDNKIEVDLYMALESGISNQLGEWQVISLAMIENTNGVSSTSATAGFPIPERYISNIVKYGVDTVMKKIFEDANYKNGIKFLTKGVLGRTDLMEEAFIMGLIKINNLKWQ